MDIFVDYYNVSSKHRRSGLVDVVDRIVSAVVPDYLDSDDKRVNLRLTAGGTRTRSQHGMHRISANRSRRTIPAQLEATRTSSS